MIFFLIAPEWSISHYSRIGNMVNHFFNGWFKHYQRIQAFNIMLVIQYHTWQFCLTLRGTFPFFMYYVLHSGLIKNFFHEKSWKMIQNCITQLQGSAKCYGVPNQNCHSLVVVHKWIYCHCILYGDVIQVASWFYCPELNYETSILKDSN